MQKAGATQLRNNHNGKCTPGQWSENWYCRACHWVSVTKSEWHAQLHTHAVGRREPAHLLPSQAIISGSEKFAKVGLQPKTAWHTCYFLFWIQRMADNMTYHFLTVSTFIKSDCFFESPFCIHPSFFSASQKTVRCHCHAYFASHSVHRVVEVL